MSEHIEFEIRDVSQALSGVSPRLPEMPARQFMQRGLNALHPSFSGKPYMPEGTGASFRHEGYLRLNDSLDFIREINEETSLAKQKFSGLASSAINAACGSYEFFDCYVLGNQGLILDVRRRICWIGVPLGWEPHHLEMFMCQPGLFEQTQDGTLRCTKALLQKMDKASRGRSPRSCVVLPIPGFRVYGHWLIDVLPRLAHATRHVDQSRVVCTSGIAPWGKELAGCYGLVTPEPPQVLSLMEGARWESIMAGTTIRSSRVIDANRARKLWSELRLALTGSARYPTARKRLYISRSKMPTDRLFANADEIEAFFRNRGWEVVYPETLTLKAQAELFAAAEFIVGDDGSGLHNCIFSPPGTPMLVLNFNRINQYHSTLAQALNHPLAFLNCESASTETGTTYELHIGKLESAIDSLLSAAT